MSETKPVAVFRAEEFFDQPNHYGDALPVVRRLAAHHANARLAPLVEALERMKSAHESFKAGTGHGCDYTGEVVAVLAAWERLRPKKGEQDG